MYGNAVSKITQKIEEFEYVVKQWNGEIEQATVKIKIDYEEIKFLPHEIILLPLHEITKRLKFYYKEENELYALSVYKSRFEVEFQALVFSYPKFKIAKNALFKDSEFYHNLSIDEKINLKGVYCPYLEGAFIKMLKKY